MTIQDTKKVWAVWTNTDLTEGRGHLIPKAVCETEATAIRMGKKGGVQGSNCLVTEVTAVMMNNCWLVPGRIYPPAIEDKKAQILIDKTREVIKKAKENGLSEDDLKTLARAWNL